MQLKNLIAILNWNLEFFSFKTCFIVLDLPCYYLIVLQSRKILSAKKFWLKVSKYFGKKTRIDFKPLQMHFTIEIYFQIEAIFYQKIQKKYSKRK